MSDPTEAQEVSLGPMFEAGLAMGFRRGVEAAVGVLRERADELDPHVAAVHLSAAARLIERKLLGEEAGE